VTEDLATRAVKHCRVLTDTLMRCSAEIEELRGFLKQSLDLNTRLLDSVERAGKLCLKVIESDCPQALKDEVLEYLKAKL
jgi:hypothetical protein